MNFDQYITSGILEKYIFGIANKNEIESVEAMLQIYPEIKDELFKIEKALEYYAHQNQLKPPKKWKRKFFKKNFK